MVRVDVDSPFLDYNGLVVARIDGFGLDTRLRQELAAIDFKWFED